MNMFYEFSLETVAEESLHRKALLEVIMDTCTRSLQPMVNFRSADLRRDKYCT